MRFLTGGVFLLLFGGMSSTVLANGGPVDFSNTVGSGNVIYRSYRGGELISENLLITPGFKYVDVEAIYILHDTGNGTRTGYAFPVDLALSASAGMDNSILVDEEVPRFEITLDGRLLEYQIRQGFNTDTFLNSYGNEQDLHRLFFTTTFEIQPSDTVELVVSYSVKARFSDFETTKNYFPGFEDRYFRYLLDPAGYWGDGTVEQLEIRFDFSELIANGGRAVSLPEGGRWIEETQYVISRNHFDMASAAPLEVSYDVSLWGNSRNLLEQSDNPEECTVTASSYLPSSGNSTYSPDNLIDRDLSTAWAEDVSGYSGEWIELQMDRPITVGFVGIICGYTKSQSVYTSNGRPRTVTVEIYREDDVFSETVTLEDLPWVEVEKGILSPLVQPIYNSGTGIITDRVRLHFDDAYPGDTCEDLCVSELFVAGWRWE